MKLSIIAMVALSLIVVSCSSTPKKEVRTFQKQYVVIDAGNASIPDWIDEPVTGSGEDVKETKNNQYFVAETNNVASKRLCIKSAQARATSEIASQIAQVIKNDYTESTQGGTNQGVEEYMNESLANEAMAFLAGAKVVKTYWEERQYKMDLGADRDAKSFTCFALVKMPKNILERAVENSVQKFLGELKDTESKQQAKEALKDVANKMNQMNGFKSSTAE